MTSEKLKELNDKTHDVGLVRGTPPPQVPVPTWGTLVPQLQTSSLSNTDAGPTGPATQGAPGRHQARASCQPGSSSSKP